MPRYKRQSGWRSFFSRYKNRPRRDRDYYGEDFGHGSFWDWWRETSPETKKGIFVICLFVVAALSVLGLLDLSGRFGQLTNYALSIILGNLKWLFPLFLAVWIFCLLNEEKYPIRFINYFGVVLFLLGLAGLFHLPYDSWQALEVAKAGGGGGYLGALVALPLLRLMNFWGTMVVLVALLLIGILLALETSIYGILWPIKLAKFIAVKIKDWYYYYKLKKRERQLEEQDGEGYEEEAAGVEEAAADENQEVEEEPLPGFVKTEVKMGFDKGEEEEMTASRVKKYGPIEIPLSLLNSKVGKPTAGDIKNNQEIIRRTLANFGIEVEMGEVNVGPTFTQYTMRPTDGVRLSRLTVLNADLALALAAHPIRIEAPIPGKSLVGIEVPNVQVAKVNMLEMLNSKEYKGRSNNLYLALGQDVSGKPIFAPLEKMPHLLIAGATGSGKSVCVNSIIISLMYQNSPDELKFILVDPKRVELPVYNSIPYLLTPVITDVKKTIGALKWAITEMERRFELLAKFGNRNIASFNQTHGDKLPYIVIIIDELADLMATAPNDMEAGIVRLAQMARAVGIHLILATQRPSTEVITGLIKANIPARVSFSVASSIDSRTILDGTGAEKLVGRGDMLYLGPDMSKPKRLQGVFVSDKEISDIIKFIKSRGEAEYDEKLLSASAGSGVSGGFGSAAFGDGDEPLVSEALEVIRESGKASASLLQRRLKLGYARAARILDILEEKGIIGPADGAKPREVFLDQLGGAGAVEFAAREHNLTGELRPLEDEDEEEPTPTIFTSESVTNKVAKEVEDESVLSGASRDEEMTDEKMPEDFLAVIDESQTAEIEDEMIAEDMDTEEIEEVEEKIKDKEIEDLENEPALPKSSSKGKKSFSEDEWT